MYTTYDEFIKCEINSFKYYGNFYDTAIKYIPYFFKLLCKALDMSDLDYDSRIKINCALAYLVVPNDVLPEDIYGAEGYMDDAFVLVYVLKELLLAYSYSLRAEWINLLSDDSNNKDLERILDDCYDICLKILTERKIVDKVLEFSGLKKPQ
jgi:uncharacterized membrane protein YkvA (DUF1232 family)